MPMGNFALTYTWHPLSLYPVKNQNFNILLTNHWAICTKFVSLIYWRPKEILTLVWSDIQYNCLKYGKKIVLKNDCYVVWTTTNSVAICTIFLKWMKGQREGKTLILYGLVCIFLHVIKCNILCMNKSINLYFCVKYPVLGIFSILH